MLVFNSRSGGGVRLTVTGTGSPGGEITAAYEGGSGTIQFTRTPIAGGATVDVGGVVPSGSKYAVQTADRSYRIGARPITFLPAPSLGIAVPFMPPEAPTIIGITAGSKQLTVSLNRSAEDGGAVITTDRVYVYNAGTDELVTTMDGASPVTVTQLADGTAYYATAASVNSIGPGPASTHSATVTPLTPTSSTSTSNPAVGASAVSSNAI